jgi:hypothetical protein
MFANYHDGYVPWYKKEKMHRFFIKSMVKHMFKLLIFSIPRIDSLDSITWCIVRCWGRSFFIGYPFAFKCYYLITHL